MKIIWTRIARITYFEILENLEKYWTANEIRAFHRLISENLSQITSGKVRHPFVDPQSEIRRMVIHSNVTLYYKIDEAENQLLLITFFNNRMDPNILRKLLNS